MTTNVWEITGVYDGAPAGVLCRCASAAGAKVFCGGRGMSNMRSRFYASVPEGQTQVNGMGIVEAEFELPEEAAERQRREAAERRKRA